MTQKEFEDKQVEVAQRYLVAYDLTASALQVVHDKAELGMQSDPEMQEPVVDLVRTLEIYENYLEAAIHSR